MGWWGRPEGKKESEREKTRKKGNVREEGEVQGRGGRDKKEGCRVRKVR